MTLAAGTPIGRYVVRRKIAEGGMAELYLCSSRGPGGFEKDVVIKRIRPFLSSEPEFVRMFIGEARLASRLNHANLVQIFDFDRHEDTYYLAMEYVRGRSLSEVRKRSKEMMIAMPPTLVAYVGAEVARGLHCAHQLSHHGRLLGLVHRDVTPHNVLLSFDGAVKLTDFGIAKANDAATSPGRLKGKFGYMSPEQSRGEQVDARTDVFALGIVLWEMLTGGRLFEADSDVGMIRAVQESAIAAPARLNPSIPPDLDAAVMRALERDPPRRYQTAQGLERALAECVLRHATSLDDTDLSAFLRCLFPGSIAGTESRTGAAIRPSGLAKTLVPVPPRAPERLAAASAALKTRLLKVRDLRLHLMRAASFSARIPSVLWVGAAAFLLVGTAVALVGARSTREGRPRGEAAPAPPLVENPERPASAEDARKIATALPQISEEDSPVATRSKLRVHPSRGTLILKVTPWAEVTLDGESLGEVSGIRRLKLQPGKHWIRFSHPRGNRQIAVTVVPNREITQEHHVFPR